MATGIQPGHTTPLPANLLERGALSTLRAHLRDAPVVQLRGSRMVGKTTLATQVCNSAWNLLAPAQRDIFNRDQRGILLGAPKPVLIDEWQAEPEVLATVKELIDHEGLDRVVIAGSAEPPPGSWGATRQFPLGGRVEELTLWPLSVAERRGCYRDTLVDDLLGGELPRSPEQLSHAQYVELIFESGYPAAVGLDQADTSKYLRRVRTAATQMLLSRANGSAGETVGHLSRTKLTDFFRIYAEQSSRDISVRELAERVNVHHTTAQRYIDLLAELHFATPLDIWRHVPSALPARGHKQLITEAAMICAYSPHSVRQLVADDALLGAATETFVSAQLHALRDSGPTNFAIENYHLRRGSRIARPVGEASAFPLGEIDFLLRSQDESAQRVIAIEVKAGTNVKADVIDKLARLRAAFDDRHDGPLKHVDYRAGIVLCAGDTGVRQVGAKEWVAPLSVLWA